MASERLLWREHQVTSARGDVRVISMQVSGIIFITTLKEMSNEKSLTIPSETARGLYIENPWERVKFIFMKNDYGENHPDLTLALKTAELGFLGGIAFGGFIHHKKFLREVKERSDARIFCSTADAGRQMSREAFSGFLEGAWKWGPKVAIFAGGFSLFASCVEAYRNKYGIVEYSIGGSVVGGLLKFNFGIKGMLVGSLVGMVLGTIYGASYVGICKLTKQDKVAVKYGQYALSKYRDELEAARKMEKESVKLGMASQPDANHLNGLTNWHNDKESKNDKVEKNLGKY